jgi:hypothetical protein
MRAAVALCFALAAGSAFGDWMHQSGAARSAPNPDGLRAWVRYDDRCKPELVVGQLTRQRTIKGLRGRVLASVDGKPIASGQQAIGRRVRLTQDAVTALQQGTEAIIVVDDTRLQLDLEGAAAALAAARRHCRGPLPTRAHNGPHWTTVSGEIDEGWAEAVMDHMRAVGATGLVIESNGGNLAEAERLGRWLRGRGLDTAVTGDCASACARAFAGGVLRFVAFGARLGLYGAALLGSGDDDREDAVKAYAGYLKSLGIPQAEAIARRAAQRTAPAQDWLQADEAIEMGLATELGTPHGIAATWPPRP